MQRDLQMNVRLQAASFGDLFALELTQVQLLPVARWLLWLCRRKEILQRVKTKRCVNPGVGRSSRRRFYPAQTQRRSSVLYSYDIVPCFWQGQDDRRECVNA